jgi:hypothetical protein
MKFLYFTRFSVFDMLIVAWTCRWDGRMENGFWILVGSSYLEFRTGDKTIIFLWILRKYLVFWSWMKLALDLVQGRLRYWWNEPPSFATGRFISRSARTTQTYLFQISRKSVNPVRLIGLQVNFWQLNNSTDTTLHGLKSDINKGNLTDENISLLFPISCRGPTREHSKILLKLLHTLASIYGNRGCFLA